MVIYTLIWFVEKPLPINYETEPKAESEVVTFTLFPVSGGSITKTQMGKPKPIPFQEELSFGS